jgi:hypothetical protein
VGSSGRRKRIRGNENPRCEETETTAQAKKSRRILQWRGRVVQKSRKTAQTVLFKDSKLPSDCNMVIWRFSELLVNIGTGWKYFSLFVNYF